MKCVHIDRVPPPLHSLAVGGDDEARHERQISAVCMMTRRPLGIKKHHGLIRNERKGFGDAHDPVVEVSRIDIDMQHARKGRVTGNRN